ncbi:hypothetical protein C0Q70_03847 [Pomacea canaliculata]|uniref:Peptidase M13 N-terminal domain-containing protein n=1 Tax=Pomacea canaliculata TaxID=400727 RepID=A0A2T7PTZ9_POMCA|nr:hypothetical protein C0Q70_03847 [Pomacea canaliculata]
MDKRGKKPLFDLLDLNGNGIYPTLQPSWKDTNMTFLDIVEYLTKVGDVGSNSFVSMGVYQDEMQSDKHIISFSQPRLVLPSRDAYLHQRNSSDLVLYETLYREVHMALGADEKTATEDAKKVVDFEIQLANVSASW